MFTLTLYRQSGLFKGILLTLSLMYQDVSNSSSEMGYQPMPEEYAFIFTVLCFISVS